MEHILLVTLSGGEVTRTFAFDERIQSVQWIAESPASSPHEALACVERKAGSMLVRSASPRVSLLLAGDDRAHTSVAIGRGATGILGVRIDGESRCLRLYIRPLLVGMGTFERLLVLPDISIVIGRDRTCDLVYESRYVSGRHAQLTHVGHGFVVEDLKSSMGTFVNGSPLPPLHPRALEAGDVIEVLDLSIMVGRDMLCANKPPGARVDALCNRLARDARGDVATTAIVHPSRGASVLVPFFPAPCLLQSVHTLSLCVDAPPARVVPKSQSAIMQLGPSMLMGMSSAFMVLNAVLGIARGADLLSVLPLAGMSVTMGAGSVVWPLIARAYERRHAEATEMQRNHLYVSYLDDVECVLEEEAIQQRKVCNANVASIATTLAMAQDRSHLLMSHTSAQEGYLQVRVGVGDRDLEADLSWPQRELSTHADDMWDRLQELQGNPPRLRDVPIVLDLADNPIAGIVGPRPFVWEIARGILLQLLANYSYREVKVALVVDEREREEWECFASLAHLHDDCGQTRLVATTQEGMRRLYRCLEGELTKTGSDDVGAGRYAHYVVLCAYKELAKRFSAMRSASESDERSRVSLVFLEEDLASLPRSCSLIVDLSGHNVSECLGAENMSGADASRGACLFLREDVRGSVVAFDPDVMVTREQARSFCLALSRVRLAEDDEREAIAHELGFLELYAVGSVSHLNVGARWREHEASRTLRAPLGIDTSDATFSLDLHEDGQGPHGLIAGTTGSGKSELIATLILSLCINYGPDEVNFLIIDYKGGGLAGAFSDGTCRLPHLSGTITNLDGSAIRRTLVSLRSELRRRQRLLNAARTRTGEATVDVRRYESLYRQGVLDEPLPHLVVIADEFAELRQQEPEFMEELMTAARIGRSLGVHLVLATQKPSGVVNDQIWSNARFKLCLKVADAADAREMVRRDTPASYVRPGQMCLLVGYDEEFVEGQAAYAGGPYVEREQFSRKADASVELLDGEGVVVARREVPMAREQSTTSELDAVIAELANAAGLMGVQAHPLWIDPLPSSISLEELDRTVETVRLDGLVCSLGLIDDPWHQRYRRLEVDLATAGGILLYGAMGSGVERLLRTAAFSAVRMHPDARIYGIDLGQGELLALECLPQCGGIVRTGDAERMENLLHLLETELAARRSPVEREVGHARPPVVLVLANLASWMDEFSWVRERLESFVREGPQHDMHVIASTGSVLGTSMRLRSSMGAEICTVLHDEGDYAMLLGSLGSACLPKSPLRGLVRKDGHVLEFLGAHVDQNTIEAFAADCRACGMPLAPRIPSLPKHVRPHDVDSLASATRLPVGLDKVGARPRCVRVGASRPLVSMADDCNALERFVAGICGVLERSQLSYRVFDPQGTLWEFGVRHVTSEEECRDIVESLAQGTCELDFVVLANTLALVESSNPGVAQLLTDAVLRPAPTSRTSIVLAMEGWRAASVYDPWLKAALSTGVALWVGNGFATQTVLPVVHSDAALRKPIPPCDGFVLERGTVHAVRLVEVADGGDEEGDSYDGQGAASGEAAVDRAHV